MTKNVEFLHLTVEGFRSYQKATAFPLAGKGVVLIKGQTGAGKTTIFSALTWALYKLNLNGTTNDKVQTWEKYRLPEWRGTRVTVTFKTGGFYYMVARHLSFKGTTKGIKGKDTLMIFKRHDDQFEQEDLVGEAQHKGNQQEYINRVIGVEPHTFLNSILFGQRMPRLVSSKNEDKRELFETLFDLDFIDPAKKRAEAERQKQEIKVAEQRQVIAAHENAIKQLKEKLDEQIALKAEFAVKKNNRVKALNDKLAELEKGLDNLRTGLATREEKLKNTKGLDEIEKLRDAFYKAHNKREEAEVEYKQTVTDWKGVSAELKEDQYEIEKAEKEVARLTKNLSEVVTECALCGTPIEKDKVAEVKLGIQKLIDKHEENIASLKATLPDIEERLANMASHVEAEGNELNRLREAVTTTKKAFEEKRDLGKEVEQTKKEVTERKTLIPHYEKNVEEVKVEIKEVEAEKPPKIDTKETEKSLELLYQNTESQNAKLIELQTELDRTNWWIKKAFSAGGLKAFVFSAMLGQLNTCIDRYASRMGFKVRFTVDLTKASKPFITKVYRTDGFEVDYSELSGGQKQRLDCMVMFAMNDLVNSLVNINFLILDEIFEGLDPANIEAIFDLIRVKAEAGKHIFLVTHNQIIDSLSTKSMYMELDEVNMVSSIS